MTDVSIVPCVDSTLIFPSPLEASTQYPASLTSTTTSTTIPAVGPTSAFETHSHTADWMLVLATLFAGVLGAWVGGRSTLHATVKTMQHEESLRRDERLRDVRAQMVIELTAALFSAHKQTPGSDLRQLLIKIERLAYSATSVDRDLAEEARRAAQIFESAQNELETNRGPLNAATARYDPSQHYLDRKDTALTDLQNALQRLDDHLRRELASDGETR